MRALARFGGLFPRNCNSDAVRTSICLSGSPEQVWKAIVFFEDVPVRPSMFLRLFLPAPVGTSGDKARVGATIECRYEDGYLEKQMTQIEVPYRIAFDVTLQQLGIENSISMRSGSYELEPVGAHQTRVILTTHYSGHLRPRWLWRPLEHALAHGLHRHILASVKRALTEPALASPPLQSPAAIE